MTERIVFVVGAGAAGLAAAWAAARHGATVRLVDSGSGVSALVGGAADHRPWEEIARAVALRGQTPLAGELPAGVADFAADLDLWSLPLAEEPLLRLATEAGRLRTARGADSALLDWTQIPAGGRVILPRAIRSEWDAGSLARSLREDTYVRSRGLKLEVVDAKLFKLQGEERIAPADLALRHDEPQRLAWLEMRLGQLVAEAGASDAILLGPWLGVRSPVASVLSKNLGLVVGEVLSGVGGAAGLRFEFARERMLAKLGIELQLACVEAVEPVEDGYALSIEGRQPPEIADAVVLAIGGVAAGGVVYCAPETRAGRDAPDRGSRAFKLSLDAPVDLRAHGKRLDVTSSIHGPRMDDCAWPIDADPGLLEAVGVDCDPTGRVLPGLYAAGDAVGDAPRTVLEAVASGIRAAAAACLTEID